MPKKIEWYPRLAVETVRQEPAGIDDKTLLEAWQYLIDTGVVWKLHSWFATGAAELIASSRIRVAPTNLPLEVPSLEDVPKEYLRQEQKVTGPLGEFFEAMENYRRECENLKENWRNKKKQEEQESARKDTRNSSPEHGAKLAESKQPDGGTSGGAPQTGTKKDDESAEG